MLSSTPPQRTAGYSTWSYGNETCTVTFVGKGPETGRATAFAEVVGDSGMDLAWPHQIHSPVVLAADRGGLLGQADALWTSEVGLALSVATADCVPIVLTGTHSLAAIHAGWRGIGSGVVAATLDALPESPGSLHAWIGPAIGRCCYEVGPDVARKVVAASSEGVCCHRHPRPHLDLTGAVAHQLAAAGVEDIHALDVCTRCSPQWLWSYRRDGAAAGRNWAFAWKR